MPNTAITRKPLISIIGMGRVGSAMAHALQDANYPLVSLVFRDSARAEGCRSLFPGAQLLGSEQLQLLPFTEVLLITTPDDAIAETARKVAEVMVGNRPRVALHTSGALSSAALSPLTKMGFAIGSMHPLVSVGYFPEGVAALRGASYCLEGHKRAVAVAENIVVDLGGESFSIKTQHKALYHAAAVLASPDIVALFDLVFELLSVCGMQRDDALRVLLGLVESTIKNLQVPHPLGGGPRSPSWALTGTFARGDVGTVELHLKALSKRQPRVLAQALELYKILGLRSLQLAKLRGLDQKKINQITKLLKAADAPQTQVPPKPKKQNKRRATPKAKPTSRRKR
jgi:predicted short-subunit dehydrogenase-like oxidoreductase (DUF2520 family)